MKQPSLEAFLHACGGSGPICSNVTPADGHGRSPHAFNQPFVLLGRDEHADICLKDPSVSRRHAFVQMLAGRFFCLDLGSRTGISWDGKGRVRDWIAEMTPFRVGPYQVSISGEAADGLSSMPNGWDPWARGSHLRYELPAITLSIFNHRKTVSRWPLNRVIALVGSASTCKVRLRGPGMSGYHCALVCTPCGVWLVDLQRRGGVVVNKTPVGHCLLEDGDQLRLGNFTVDVDYDAMPLSSPIAAPVATGTQLVVLSDPSARSDATELIPEPRNGTSGLALWRETNSATVLPTSQTSGTTTVGSAAEGLSADLLHSLLQQFSDMQRQMFDQSMMMMFQMFRTMHGEQVEVLRQELERFDELNREVQALLAQRLPDAAASPPVLPAWRTAGQAPPAACTRPEASAKREQDDQSAANTGKPPHVAIGRTTARTGTVSSPQPDAASEEDLHIWLCQRMEAIQHERQGLWERITGALRKKE
jgi:pSer/pThr/pTyr-binding forkhead associated (FHA) protein